MSEQPSATGDPAGLVLTVDTVVRYLADRPLLSALVATDGLSVTEVGDGNLNQVFICRDVGGRSLVLKQALPYVRLVGPSWPMTEERAAREAAAIRAHSSVSADVCRLIEFDAEQHVLALEDLSDHVVLRTHLNDGADHSGIAERLGTFVADVAFGTSFLTVGEEQFRQRAADSINPELCALTEDVIFTEPFLGAERNSVRRDVQPVLDALQEDAEWIDAAMQLKLRFLTVQEALLHGDLHSGSVFVRLPDERNALSIKTFDSEFACYGPIGFDLGLLWANLLAAGVRATVLGEADRGRSLLAGVAASWATFRSRLGQLWPGRQQPAKYPDRMLPHWLESIRVDALGFAGCEAARRIIGLAKISDVETLTGDQHRRAATAILQLSRLLLVQRSTVSFDELSDTAVELAG